MVKRFQYQNKTNPVVVPPPVSSGWYKPLSNPVRKNVIATALIAASGLFAPVPAPLNTQTIAAAASSAQVIVKNRLIYQSKAEPIVFSQEIVTVDKWIYSLSDPVRIKQGLSAANQQVLAFVKADPFPETTSVDRYWQPFAEPVRQKQGLAVTEQRPTFWSHFTPEAITIDKWLYPLSEPVRLKPGLAANKQQFFTTDPFSLTRPETVSEDRWHQPWSGPVRVKSGLSSANQQALFFVKADPFPESTTVDRYYRPLSEPVRLRAAQQQLLIYPPVVSETITLDKWFAQLSSPVRIKLGLLAGEQQYLAFVKSDPFPESTTVDRYLQPLSLPVRIRISQQQAIVAPPTIPEIITIDKWLYQLSEPVRRRLAQQQQTIAFNERPIPPFNWFTQSLDPTRRKLGPQYQQQPSFVQIIVPIDRWLQGLSIPQRLAKSGLLTSSQPFFFTSPLPPAVLASQWLYGLTEPVRTKPGLLSSLQSSTVWPPRVIPNIVTLVMSATETGQDTATFSIRLLQPAVSARVSIVEIPVGSGSLYSLRES